MFLLRLIVGQLGTKINPNLKLSAQNTKIAEMAFFHYIPA